jgi:hypothetical protein
MLTESFKIIVVTRKPWKIENYVEDDVRRWSMKKRLTRSDVASNESQPNAKSIDTHTRYNL